MPDTLTTHPLAAAPAAGGAPGEIGARAPKAGYWIAALVTGIALVAAIAFGIVGTLRTLDRPDDFARTAIPGALTVTGAAGGEQVIYYEGDARPGWRRLDVRVIGPGGMAVPVSAYHDDLEYDADGRVAKAIATFATAGGRYRVSATVAAEPDARLAVGRDLAADMTTTVLWAGVIALGGLLAAAAIAAAAWRRSGKTT
jgi:hypothetical protein